LGESEKALADVFAKARHNAPCLLLLDQLEAIGDSRLEQMQRMVGQLVRELDDIAAFPEVAVIAATNRPELIDPAVKRRFDYTFEVPVPDAAEREAILRLHLAPFVIGSSVIPSEARNPSPGAEATDASLKLSMTKGLTGADIAAAVRRARLAAIQRTAPARNGHKPELRNAETETLTIQDLEEACRSITR